MIELKNVLEVLNEIIILPITIITFFLLMYIVVYLRKKDPDILRSRIFLKYGEFKTAFLLLAVFAFFLIIHVSLIYIPHFISYYNPLTGSVQEFFGLAMTLTMIAFVATVFRSLK